MYSDTLIRVGCTACNDCVRVSERVLRITPYGACLSIKIRLHTLIMIYRFLLNRVLRMFKIASTMTLLCRNFHPLESARTGSVDFKQLRDGFKILAGRDPLSENEYRVLFPEISSREGRIDYRVRGYSRT